MIDWPLVQRLASFVAGQPDTKPLAADLGALSRESAEAVIAYTGLAPHAELPVAEAVERSEWIRANIASMSALLDPALRSVGRTVAKPARPFVQLGAGVVMTAEVGVMLGFLAQRVLGQYEIVLLDTTPDDRPPRLLYVAPNLANSVRTFRADEREFLHWVALHEITHAVQFAGVPWLQRHMAGMVRELLDSAQLKIDTRRALRLPRTDDFKKLVEVVRSGDIVTLVASPNEKRTIDTMQATMAVIEGYAEHVMDAVGEPLLPGLPRLRASLDSRRRSQSAPARLMMKLLGMEMKMRQYQQGKVFCDAVVRAGGIEALNRVWRSPASMPTLAEIEDPLAWLRRTDVPPALTA
ncbi:zinc-dependent metalloprotease [Conexibacter sp. CPCC 206217]|uniref:zinc-dependent metalloprotease n=1 Tax=Conexibacter sp. CPCC 206217 TaxID=3064574 RepID=UPI002723048E|nr:zinc-dependent metalloprotease [Conexibacter sp. CPCC 206217]MDO8213711.1 zinc-dependent metalloprotease [Conexibacter sp. CPCC 206217]